MSELGKRIKKKINHLIDENALRTLREPDNLLIDFNSNDYLGLARSAELHQEILERSESVAPQLNGATGSRLLSGNSKYIETVERKLAGIFYSETTLIFNSGYTANMGVLSSIPQKGDTIFYDERSHACIKDGARLSLAKRFSFRHNDVDNLRDKLKKNAEGLSFIVVESIYSMDGDQCPLAELVEVAKEFDALIILDEAHSTGIMGGGGSGLAVTMNLEEHIPIRIYTFGKAMGVHGACVACSEDLKKFLINFSRPFIYTTALPQHSVASIDCAFDYLWKNLHLQKTLVEKTALFKRNCLAQTHSDSPIQPIVIPGIKFVKAISETLSKQGFDIRPILSPTVKPGMERLRICLHTFNDDQQIVELSSTLNQVCERFKIASK
jgi:8-amino-7-oxononanoate synthase